MLVCDGTGRDADRRRAHPDIAMWPRHIPPAYCAKMYRKGRQIIDLNSCVPFLGRPGQARTNWPRGSVTLTA